MIVYRHRRLDTNEIFYVGIGKSKYRATEKARRSEFWKRIVNKTDYSVEIIAEVDTWEEACELEQLLIQEYGRINLGTGTLCNLTDGGDGTLGCKGELNHFYGKKHSEEAKLKVSLANKGKRTYGDHPQAKAVINKETGVIYPTIKEAAEKEGFKNSTLWKMLNGRNPNKTNLILI